jgi:hypothetical protein
LFVFEEKDRTRFAEWLKNVTARGLWVAVVGANEYMLCEPREWFCECGLLVTDGPVCAHGGVLSEKSEHKAQFFNVLLWDVATPQDFERECEADRSGRPQRGGSADGSRVS